LGCVEWVYIVLKVDLTIYLPILVNLYTVNNFQVTTNGFITKTSFYKDIKFIIAKIDKVLRIRSKFEIE